MKDQVHYNSTPDQGWSKLRPILDEAMPVNRPARRFAFLWWYTSAVLMSGVLGLFVFRGVDFFTQPITTEVPALNSNQNHNSAPRQTKDELNAHKSKVNTPTTTPALTVPNQKSEPTNIKSDHKNHKSLKPVAPPKTGKKPLPSEPMAEVKTNQMNVVDNLSVATNSSATAAFPHELSTNVEGSASQETMQDRSTQCGIIPFQVVESIPILSNTSLEANETNSNLIIPGKANKVKKSTPFIEPTISASGLIGLNGGVGGSVTAGVDLNVSRRFSVTTGVGYLGYRPDASFFGGAQDFFF